jgi:hypothetical protein
MKKLLTGLVFLLSITILVAQNSPCACCTEAHTEFDFWIGEWEVTLPSGVKAGENTIIKEQAGCVLKESWKTANGNFTGTSFNYYNVRTREWEQLWLDVAGTILKLKGKRVANQMILRSDPVSQEDGSSQVQQITYTLNEDKSIRQLWEVLHDEVSVSILFDGLYTKKN